VIANKQEAYKNIFYMKGGLLWNSYEQTIVDLNIDMH